MTTYSIEKNKVRFTGDNSVDFEYLVKGVFEVDDVLIVWLDITDDASEQLNVFGFNTSGDFLWRIDNVKMYYEGKACPYIDVAKNDQNEVVLFNWCDTAVIIDPQTGNIIRTYQTK
ncbi:hypothetical protein AAFN85_14720 [Mucilaginibacter sp. CAU 1740]|uniref:hypothetical protein n=1 Tax=Mucilaginibacter sp. CAU 1740 TaxID=3140365 RepID=UPI00325AF946